MKKPAGIDVSTLSNVPETMLIPLYLKAKETSEKGIINDQKAVEIIGRINYDFSRIAKDWKTQISVAVRTILFDEIVEAMSTNAKKPVIVNLGAGLDTRQERFPDFKWYQLDLPQSIEIRKQFFNNDEAILIPKSILDFSWIEDIKERENVLFIAEGLLMYFSEDDVKLLLKHISNHFTHSFIVLNTIHKMMIGKKHASIDTEKAPFKWGIGSIKDVEDWNLDWETDQIYYSLDYHKRRWRWIKWLSLISSMRTGFVIAVLKTKE